MGGYGTKIDDSNLRFIEGQLPEHEGRVESDESPAQQLELVLQNLEAKLNQRGQGMDNVLQLTLYLADMDAYESINETYERYFDATSVTAAALTVSVTPTATSTRSPPSNSTEQTATDTKPIPDARDMDYQGGEIGVITVLLEGKMDD
jgi:enamine deaminase RidA (YjgF/YER057c/UK114 family)